MLSLFKICIRNDSLKVAMQIYLRFMSPTDISVKNIDMFIHSIVQSVKFYEIKLFFLLEHFDLMTIQQMNQLMDNLLAVLKSKRPEKNPMLSQYNSIKVALLIYRVSWRIEKRKVYSLITKCGLINDYIMKSITIYLRKQENISQLYKLMRERIFSMSEAKDSLDIMLEMEMESLLNHPVIVEVLNLVNEGKFSVDGSILSLSRTFMIFFN